MEASTKRPSRSHLMFMGRAGMQGRHVSRSWVGRGCKGEETPPSVPTVCVQASVPTVYRQGGR